MRVIVSSGIGPLHFIDAVRALTTKGVDICIIIGVQVSRANSVWVRLASKLAGRDLSSAFAKRCNGLSGCKYYSRPWAELVYQGLVCLSRFVPVSSFTIEHFVWTFLGWNTRMSAKGYNVFHCRSGAGQGGAIRCAKKYGAKVLVDQSALHPRTCEKNLKDDYDRWGMPVMIAPGRGVWVNVEQDCKMADMILVNADHIKQSFVENGYPADKIRVVYLGVRGDFVGVKKNYAAEKKFKVLFTGAATILKGCEYLLESLRILVNRGVDVEYTIVGSVQIPSELKERYSALPVRYVGRIPQDELMRYFSTSDAYVFPSLADGCAKAGMEAMAAGLPVVATVQSGLPITDGVDGYLIPMKNASAIADKVEYLIRNPSERERIGHAAAELIRKKYTWDRYAEAVKKVYEELLDERLAIEESPK